MKIHTKIVIDMASDEVLEDVCHDYEGPIAQAGSGGGGGQPAELVALALPQS